MDIRHVMELGDRDLSAYAAQLGIPEYEILPREAKTFQVICGLMARRASRVDSSRRSNRPELAIEGVLVIETSRRGQEQAILRYGSRCYLPTINDVVVPMGLVRKYGLRTGDRLAGFISTPPDRNMNFELSRLASVNGRTPVSSRHRRDYSALTAVAPSGWLNLEYAGTPPSQEAQTICRAIDIAAPIGRGQRALIVAPPRTGKTILMREMARSIETNHPDAHLMVLLVDERPEEVTQMREALSSEVLSSNFDAPPEEHVSVAEMALDKARSLVEFGRDVVIVLDSITRLARSYNTLAPSSGRVLSGGVDSGALEKPKKFFGAARAFREGGSLTIIATALVETGSRMDEVIFEEFKGTGNAEIVLDRRIAEKRVYPAIDLARSGTRQDDLLFDRQSYALLERFRQTLLSSYRGSGASVDMTRNFIEGLRRTSSNVDLLTNFQKVLAQTGESSGGGVSNGSREHFFQETRRR